jgi:flavin-binding protein dodecin
MPATEMKDHVYKILELVGSSEKRIEDAIQKCHHPRIKDHPRDEMV